MPTSCNIDGSSNFVNRSLTYTSGKFSGLIKTNLCPNRALPIGTPAPSPSCIEQSFPTTTSTPSAAGLLGRVGMTLSGGVNIYGPFDAGFVLGQACNNSKGECDAGSDVETCQAQLQYQCGTGLRQIMMPDACGGHAMPYHFHTRLACEYQAGAAAASMALLAEYTKNREQFGKPIATFQAVGQRAADAYVDAEAIRLTAWQAAWRLDEGLPADKEIAVAKFWAADGGQRVVHAAVHLHGGVGVDREYPLHRFFLNTKHIELTLGGATDQLLRLGATLAAEPA